MRIYLFRVLALDNIINNAPRVYCKITQYGSTVYIGIAMVYITIKPILKENSDLTFSFKLFPFLVTSMSKTYKKE